MIIRLLIATVVLAPLPLGAARTWSWSLLAAVVALLLMAWGLGCWLAGAAPAVGLGRVWLPLRAFALAAAWVVAQMLPLTPAAWHHPLWAEAARALGGPPGAPLAVPSGAVSLEPFASGTALMRLLAYGGIFWLSLQHYRAPGRARQSTDRRLLPSPPALDNPSRAPLSP